MGAQGKVTPEVTKLREKVEKDPTSKLFVPLAEEYIKCGMLDEAMVVLKEGLEIHPTYLTARVSLGKVYLRTEQIAQARDEFEGVVNLNPDNLLAHRKLAKIYQDEGNLEGCRASCQMVLAQSPKDKEMLSFLEKIDSLTGKKEQPSEAEAPPFSIPDIDLTDPQTAHAEESVYLDNTISLAIPPVGTTPIPTSANEPPAPEPTELLDSSILDPCTSLDMPSISVPENFDLPETVSLEVPSSIDGESDQGFPAIEPIGSLLDQFTEERREEEQDASAEASCEPENPLPIEVPSEEANNETSMLMDAGPQSCEDSWTSLKDEIEAVEQTVVEGMEDGFLSVTLADLYVNQGNFEKGVEIYRRILSKSSTNHEVRNKLLLAEQSLRDKAVEATLAPTNVTEEGRGETVKSTREERIQRLQTWLESVKKRGTNA